MAVEARAPLAGVKILDFTWYLAGAWATKWMAELGAEVLRVESRTHIDVVRVQEPQVGGIGVNRSGMFATANTSKCSFEVNSRHPKGLELLKRLVLWADVVADNFSPGAMDRMGLGYNDLIKIKPDIVVLSSSSFGKKGVLKDRRGAAHTGAAFGGFWYTTGYPDGEPQHSEGIAWADLIEPMFSVVALIGALDYRRRTGKGQFIDITQIETMNHLLGPWVLNYTCNEADTERMAARHIYACPHGVFRCRGDDQWCAIAVFTEEEWQALCRVMGKASLAQDARFNSREKRKENEDELERLIEAWTINLFSDEVMDALQKAGVPAGVVQTAADTVDRDPHVKDRNLYPIMEHSVLGNIHVPVLPVKFHKTKLRTKMPPTMGQHNEYVIKGILGMSDEEFRRLTEEGVFE